MYRRKLLKYIFVKEFEFRLFWYALNSNKYGSQIADRAYFLQKINRITNN